MIKKIIEQQENCVFNHFQMKYCFVECGKA